MSFGVTPQGFVRKRLSDIKEEIEERFRNVFGRFINLLPSALFSQIIGIFADREDKIWEMAEATYQSRTMQADGVNLENVVALTAVKKLDEQNTTQNDLHLYGDNGTVVPAGTQVGIPGNPELILETLTEVTLGVGADEVQTVDFGATPNSGSFALRLYGRTSDLILHSANAAFIQDALNEMFGDLIEDDAFAGITVTGTFATLFTVTFGGLAGKANHPLMEVMTNTLQITGVDVAVTVAQTTPGEAQAVVDAEATEAGPFAAPAGTVREILTPVSGLDNVLNLEDAIAGRFVEEDNDLRLRHKSAQTQLARGTVTGLQARIRALVGVTNAFVLENDTDSVDVNGLPAHSFRAVVQGGEDQDIWDVIFANKPAGIRADGTEIGIVIDDDGFSQTVRFSRPTEVPCYVEIEVDVDDTFPLNGEELIRAAIVAFFADLQVGQDIVVFPKLMGALNNIDGITDVAIGIDTSPAPTPGVDDSNIVISATQIAVIETPADDIGVTVNA